MDQATATPATETRFSALIESWEKQQAAYIAGREDRFDVMKQALADHVGTSFTFIDLGCGLGSLTQRVLDAFPLAKAVAIDTDPVLLTMARSHLARFGERVTIIDADLRDADWTKHIAGQQIDAAISTTALHWLNTDQLIQVYADIAALMPEGGMFLNGDHMAYDRTDRISIHLAEADKDRALRKQLAQEDTLDWDAWWKAAEQEPALQQAFKERAQRQKDAEARHGARKESLTNLSLHMLALRQAGCTEVGTIWQRFDDRVLMGIKGRRFIDQNKTSVSDQVKNYWNDPQRSQEYDTDSMHPEGYDREAAYAAWRKEFASVMPPAPANVLDLGCGPGFVSVNLAGMGYQVRGIDMAENMLKRAREDAQAKGLDITFELGDATCPAGTPKSYDAIVSRYLFWTLPDPMSTLTAAKELLKPGALMAVFDGTWYSKGWNQSDYVGKPWYDLWYEVYNAQTRNNLPLMTDNDAPKVAALLEAAGYENVQWRPLKEVEAMNLRTMGTEHDDGETYVVWGYAPQK